ncbi:MAG: NAD-dependent epimerase/dehydratase family protein, partial [Chitinophagaceae bacterium]
MRRVIVTGASGFLGRHVTRDLRRHGVQVNALA